MNLWIGNDRGTDWYWRDAAREAFREAEPTPQFTRGEAAQLALADRLQDQIEENCPFLDSGLYADLLHAALAEVDLHEVATALLEDVIPDEAAEPIE